MAPAADIRASGRSGSTMGIVLGVLALLAGFGALGVVLWREFLRPNSPAEARIPSPPQTATPVLPRELQPPPRAAEQSTPAVKPQVNPAQSAPPAKGPNRSDTKRPSAEQLAEKLPSGDAPRQVAIGPIEPIRPQPPQGRAPETPPKQEATPRPQVPPGSSPAEAFRMLSRAGGIIPDAKTVPELYHNARSYEARGEAANARQQYLKLAELGGDFLDPHLRFAALLRAQDGRAGARELYARIAENTRSRPAAIVHALQFEGADRRGRIAALAAEHGGYGPIHLLLADEYSADRNGNETITDRRAQLAALKMFLDADRQGKLSQYFLDHSVLAEWLDRARTRQGVLEKFLQTAKLQPSTQFMRSSSGWMVSVWLPEAATRVAWRVAGDGDFKSTGETGIIDQRTGKPMPNLTFELPPEIGDSMLELRYDDADGKSLGPFKVSFQQRNELVKSQRDILQRFANSWIAFSEAGASSRLVYFTHLVSYRCAISKVVMVFDDSPLPMQLRMPPCDPANPNAIPANFRPYIAMPPSAKSVTVEVAFADGAASEKRKFERR